MRNSLWLGTAIALVLGPSSMALAQQLESEGRQQEQALRQTGQSTSGQAGQQIRQQAQKLDQVRTDLEQAEAQNLGQPVGKAKQTLQQIRQALTGARLPQQQTTRLTDSLDQAEEALEKAAESQDKQAAVQAITRLQTSMARMQTAQAGQSGSQTGTASRQQTAGAEPSRVQVRPDAADVQVTQPAPDVTVQQSAPDVTVRQARPDVTVTQPEPEVSVSQAEPQVQVQQQDEPTVRVIQEGGQAGSQPAPGAIRQEPVTGTSGSAERSTTAPSGATAGGTAGSVGVAQAENLIGQSVTGPTGDDIGDVSDLLIEESSGEVQGMIVDVGGFLGLGERQVYVPWEQARYNPTDQSLTVPMTREQLEQMPEFNYDQIEQGMVGMRQR